MPGRPGEQSVRSALQTPIRYATVGPNLSPYAGAVNEKVLPAAEWHARAAAHEARVDAWLGAHLARRRDGVRHPVEDFLFTYYSYRPAQLRRWHPGSGVVLADAPPAQHY